MVLSFALGLDLIAEGPVIRFAAAGKENAVRRTVAVAVDPESLQAAVIVLEAPDFFLAAAVVADKAAGQPVLRVVLEFRRDYVVEAGGAGPGLHVQRGRC